MPSPWATRHRMPLCAPLQTSCGSRIWRGSVTTLCRCIPRSLHCKTVSCYAAAMVERAIACCIAMAPKRPASQAGLLVHSANTKSHWRICRTSGTSRGERRRRRSLMRCQLRLQAFSCCLRRLSQQQQQQQARSGGTAGTRAGTRECCHFPCGSRKSQEPNNRGTV